MDTVGTPRPPPVAAFAPTRAEALRRIEAIDAAAYARTRNRLDGAVTRLSPYLTHGVVTVPEVIAALAGRGVTARDKIVFELAWREYWHHVWRHLGDGIFSSTRELLPPTHYLESLPTDVIGARSGVPAIDAAVQALYRDGYVHNHARMWLASYLVHLRKSHWQAGAPWLYSHLLDGDLASNALSWQWVAGTFSAKPYLFNHDNVVRHAPHLARAGTVLDRSYAELERMALCGDAVDAEPDAPARGTPAPQVVFDVPARPAAWPSVASRRVALVHPWMLGERPAADVVIGVWHRPFHARFGWSRARWDFTQALMAPLVDGVFVGDLHALADLLSDAREVSSTATLNPGYREALESLCTRLDAAPRHFPDPPRLQRSFSQFWTSLGYGRFPPTA